MDYCNLTKTKKLFYCLLIIFTMYLSGNIFCMSYYYMQFVLFLVAFVSFALIIFGNLKYKNHAGVIVLFLFLILCMLVTILLNSETRLNSYIAIALQIYIAIVLSNIIDFRNFEIIYVKIITAIAIISIIGFTLSQLYPQIVYLFPKTKGISSLDYYNAIVHVFTTEIGYSNLVVFNRNAGIFWEPGCYQAFLNIGIYFLLDLFNKGIEIKYKKSILVILIITVLTTYSTNGYLILALLLILFNKTIAMNYFKGNKTFLLTVIILISSMMLLIYTKNISLPFDVILKIKNEFSNGGALALERIAFDKFKYLFYNNQFNFLGLSFSTFKSIGDSCWNSIIHTMICLGIPFTITLLIFYYKFSKKMMSKPVIFFIILLMCFSTETLFWRPFFLYFIFTGIYSIREGT